jgi:hypothetical protein
VYFLLYFFVFAASYFRPFSSPLVLCSLGDLCVRSAFLSFASSTSFSSFNSFSLKFLANPHPLTSLESDSYKNIRGRGLSVLLIKNSALTLESLLARSLALFVRSLRSFTKECSRTLLQPTRSALFFKTAGCMGFLPILVHPEPAAVELLTRLPMANCVSCGSDGLSEPRGRGPRSYTLPLSPAILKGRFTRYTRY